MQLNSEDVLDLEKLAWGIENVDLEKLAWGIENVDHEKLAWGIERLWSVFQKLEKKVPYANFFSFCSFLPLGL